MSRPNTYREYRNCSCCGYPMLRAERLEGISDEVSSLNPARGWIPVMLYEIGLGLLGACLAGGVTVGLLLLYRASAGAGGPTLVRSVAVAVLVLAAVALWYGRKRLGQDWSAAFSAWKIAARNEADSWQGHGLVRRRASSKGGSGGAGFIWLLYVPIFALPPLAPLLTDNLPFVARVAALLAGLLALLFLPTLLTELRRGRTGLRRQKRLRLMQQKSPDDWVCPNCLHSEAAASFR